MALNNISLFRMEPKERVQLILGTNGSGKSSLLRELTPLPAAKEHYTNDGYKKIVIEHRGHTYCLESYFSPQQYHRFEKDGVNLNAEMGTLSVQKTLVEQEFGITPELHALLTGEDKFTRMSPAQRRQLLTKLSETDYSYAIATYNRIRERHRDISGALKLAKKQLVEETGKVVDAEAIERLEKSIEQLVEQLNLLYALRNDERRSVDELENNQAQLLKTLSQDCDRFFSSCEYFKGQAFIAPQELQEHIAGEREALARLNATSEALGKEFMKLKDIHNTYTRTGAVGIGELRNDRLELLFRKRNLRRQRRTKFIFDDVLQASLSFESCYETLEHCFSNLAENSDRRFSQAGQAEAEKKEQRLKAELEATQRALTQHQSHHDHLQKLKSGEQTQCPRCNHRWHPGYSNELETALSSKIEAGTKQVAQLKTELTQTQERLQSIRVYGELFRDFVRCVRSYPALKPFWDELQNTNIIWSSPRQVLYDLLTLKTDLKICQDIVKLDGELKKNQDLLDLAMKAKELDIGRVTQRMGEIETELGYLAGNIRLKSQQIQRQVADKARIEEILVLEKTIRHRQELLEKGFLDLARSLNNQIVNDMLKRLQLELSEKQRSLNDIRMQKSIIDNIQKNVEDLTLQEQAYKALVTELSPTEGLIAEGLLGFIRIFVAKMNQLIRNSWAYRMEVLDCSTESDSADLDYKFPVLIGDGDEPTKDIGKTSAGQEEMINLAFRIVAMTYAGLSNAWLILDEFGAAMDENHRDKAIVMIKTLLEQLPFSQMFMVSHYYHQYMAFQNAQVAVLSDLGITVPKQYNEHVVIE